MSIIFKSIIVEPINFTKERLISFKSQISWSEYSGSFGALGELLPILISLSKLNKINISAAFFWGGLFNIITAFQWNIPMPVEAMKSIAAVGIANGMTGNEIITSGIMTGSIVTVLGYTRMIDLCKLLIPQDIISGLQVGLGLNMMIKAVAVINSKVWIGTDSYLTALLLGGASLVLFKYERAPVALFLFIAGICMSIYLSVIQNVVINVDPRFPPFWAGGNLTIQDFENGFIKGVLPQLPITIFNSVISTCNLGDSLFPGNCASQTSVSISIGLMNVVACLLGGIPMCHGAGGLAAQYTFGARGGFSILILGIEKLLLSIIFGVSLIQLLTVFPDTVNSLLIIFSGLQLVMVGIKKCNSDVVFAISSIIIVSNTSVAFCVGYGMFIIKHFEYKKSPEYKKTFLEYQTKFKNRYIKKSNSSSNSSNNFV